MNLFKTQCGFHLTSKIFLTLLLFIMSSFSLHAVWNWIQQPNPTGTDVDFVYPNRLADDWFCTQTGPIKSICFATSWKQDVVGIIDSALVQIYADIPDPDGQGPLFSQPGNLLWSHWLVPLNSTQLHILGNQSWYDPWTHTYLADNHLKCYKNPITVPDSILFIQQAGTVYWLSISVAVNDPVQYYCGWKTTLNPWNDQAVYSALGWHIFQDNPPTDTDLAFKLFDYLNVECPVELSSFAGYFTGGLCQVNWVTQSETNVQGYNIYRNTENILGSAVKMNPSIILANNSSETSQYLFSDTETVLNENYYYWLESTDYDGESTLFGPVNINTFEGITPPPVPATLMSAVYPNPASAVNPQVDVSIKANETGVLSIYNVKGQLVNSFNLQTGNHKFEWNRTDSHNNKCAEGIYFYQLVTPTLNQTRKVLILK